MNDLIEALAECLKSERTLAACFGGYRAYFGRWRIHRTAKWMAWNHEAAEGRAHAIEDDLCRLGAMPSGEMDSYELEPVDQADDIARVWAYFEGSLTATIAAYRTASDAARDAADATSCHLCGSHQRAVEDTLQRIQAKQNKVQLIGAAAYIAHHMHEMG